MNHFPQYKYLGGQYSEFRGYVFAYGKPTEIKDEATADELSKRADYERTDHGEGQEGQGREITKTLLVETNPDACPKCGRVVRQGRYLHVKYCTGVQ